MKKIYLISCVKQKKSTASTAEKLYTSTLFKKMLAYAKYHNADKIYIISAKYGLLLLDEYIEPYNNTLLTKSKLQKKIWAEKVFNQLKNTVKELQNYEIVILGGKNYYEYLLQILNYYEYKVTIPLKGLSIGRMLKFLKENTNYDKC